MTTFYHLTTAREWDAGKAAGAYTTSTRGRTLEQQGSLHGKHAGVCLPPRGCQTETAARILPTGNHSSVHADP